MKLDFSRPPGLSAVGKEAYEIIVRFLKDNDLTRGEGRVFYSPKEWQDRKEDYGTNSELIVTYGGGSPVAKAFSYDAFDYVTREAMKTELSKARLHSEDATGWYGYIVDLNRG